MAKFSFALTGEVPSKKNRYRISAGGLGLHKDKGVQEWETDAALQITEHLGKEHKYEHKTLEGPITLHVQFYCKRDKDLDNMLNSICDLLEMCEIYTNDSQIRAISAVKFLKADPVVGPKAPCCLIQVSPLKQN